MSNVLCGLHFGMIMVVVKFCTWGVGWGHVTFFFFLNDCLPSGVNLLNKVCFYILMTEYDYLHQKVVLIMSNSHIEKK